MSSHTGRRAVLHGRDEPLRLLHERLEALLSGRGGVVVVHGRAGMGKSALLAEIMAVGTRRGVRVVHGACDVLTYSTPLAPLLTAVTASETLLGPDEIQQLCNSSDQPFWLGRTLQRALERAALDRPMLVVLDDLQWADAATLFALTLLTEKLRGLPLLWLIAVRTEAASALVSAALDRLTRMGAARTEAGPLALPAVTGILRDLLDVDPGPELSSELAGVEAQPQLMVELLRGLREEGSIDVIDGTAKLGAASLPPHRVRELVTGQLQRLSSGARQSVQLGAALGQRFTAAELAVMADRSPVAMIATIREVIAAGLLVSQDTSLCFRHELVRVAVEAEMPATLFSALRRKAVAVRLENGAPPAEVAALVLEASQEGGAAAAELLERTATAVGRTAPAMALQLNRRALDLSAPGDPGRPALIARTAELLVRDGRMTEARSLLSGVPTEATTSLRIATLALLIDPRQTLELTERCRRLPDTTPAMTSHCLALAACASYILGDDRAAGEALDRLVGLAEASADPAARKVALIPAALQAMKEHNWRLSLELVAEVVSDSVTPRHWVPEVWQALLLIATARLDQALHLVEARLDDSRQRGLTALVLAWTMIRARALLDAGRLVEARNEAVGVLDLAAELRTSTGYVCEIARYVIGCVGLHIGTPADLDSAREAAARLRTAELPMSRQLGAVLTAQLTVVEKTSDPPADVTGLTLLPVIFPGSHADAVRLTRLLVEAGDRQQAEALASRLAHLVATHPDFPFLRGSAAHARALLDADPGLAATAAALHHDDPRPLVRASALEDTGRMLPSTDRVQAVAHLSEALNLYVTAGADLDATRVRALLRKRGVRRNAASSRPPPDSWTQLTESEYRVAQLVATGSTNRAVAERLHLSPHTVNSHLRRIFSKLGVRSRVELTRIVAEGPRPQPR